MKETGLPTPLLPRVMESLLLLGLILAPLAVIPIFANFFVTSKLLLLFLTGIVFGGLFVWKTIKNRSIEVPHSPLVVGLSLFGISALISSVLTTQYPVENLLGMGGMYIALAVLAITGGQFLRARSDVKFMNILNISAALLALSTIGQQFGYGPGLLLNQLLPLNIPAGPAFNLTGSIWLAFQLLAVVTIANVVSFVIKRKINVVQGIAMPIILIGLFFSLWAIIPGKPTSPAFVPFALSWSIAIDSLKTPRVALIGLGPENYSDAFQVMKPGWVNSTAFWNRTIGQGSDLPLTLVPTVGLIGLAAWGFLVVKILSQVPVAVKRHPGLVAVIVSILVLQILTAPSLVLSWIQAIALAYLIASREEGKPLVLHLFKITYLDPEMHQDRKHLASFLSWGLPIVVALALAAALLWPLTQAYAASHFFFRGLVAQQANDLGGLYANQQRAAQLNRYISGYRSNFAMTSLIGARALASDEATAKDNQQSIGTLIQQAINEGRAAAALRPLDRQNWYVLGQVYGAIVGTTEDALQWAVAAYTQAIQVNPTNPIYRIELGTLLYRQERYEDAALLFQQAYELKPDLTNASYSLATTLRQLQQYQKAQAAYQAALSTLSTDSEEYKTIKAELDSLPAAAQAATGSAQVNPSATQQNVEPPQEAVEQGPEEPLPNVNPEPSPTATPEPEQPAP